MFSYLMAFFFLVVSIGIGFLAYQDPITLMVRYQGVEWNFPAWLAVLLNLGLILGVLAIQAFVVWIKGRIQALREYCLNRKRQRLQNVALAEQHYLQTLHQCIQNPKSSTQQVKRAFESGTRDLQYHPEARLGFARFLHQKGLVSEAQVCLEKGLNSVFYDSWLRYYGLIPGANPKEQLKYAEKWIKSQPENAILWLTLGRLAIRNQLWGQAKSHFQESLRLFPLPETQTELGRLVDFLGDPLKAESYYKQSALLSLGEDKVAYPRPQPMGLAPKTKTFLQSLMGS